MKSLRIILLLWLCCEMCHPIFAKEDHCYFIKFSKTSWTDRRPRVEVNMTFSAQGTVDSIAIFNEEIPSPISHISVTFQLSKEKPRTICNITTKLCDVQNFFNQVPLIRPARDNMLTQSNLTFSCPLTKGTYVMNNMHINPKNPVLAIVYSPKRTFVLEGGLFEKLSNKSLRSLTTYYMSGKIIKKVCDNKAGNN